MGACRRGVADALADQLEIERGRQRGVAVGPVHPIAGAYRIDRCHEAQQRREVVEVPVGRVAELLLGNGKEPLQY